MKRRETMYVASPYGAIAKHIKNPAEAHRIAIICATRAVRRAVELGYHAFSPVLAFNNIYDEFQNPGDREKAMEAGFAFLDLCDTVGLADSIYSKDSDGMKAEEQRAYKNGQRVIVLEGY